MEKIGIIGAGPAGLAAAIFSKSNNNEVMILEKNKNCGKKLLLTGSGKCNYWNDDADIRHFHSANTEILNKIINKELQEKAKAFIRDIGIIPIIKNGYYYPVTKEAFTMQMALVRECIKNGIIIKNECEVINIQKENQKFIVETTNGTMLFDKLVIATGGLSYPKTGSDGNGYYFMKEHSLITPRPSLVQLTLQAPFLKKWAGIRTQAKVSLINGNQIIKEETGELQLTDYGASGICIFNISREVRESSLLKINFLPFLSVPLNIFLEDENKRLPNRSIQELLENLLHFKLVDILLKEANVNGLLNYNELTEKEVLNLINVFTSLMVKITGTKGFLTAQVTSGGIPLHELNTINLMSKKVDNLFYAGEILDIDGDCGGYNLMTAFMTGIMAGEGAKNA